MLFSSAGKVIRFAESVVRITPQRPRRTWHAPGQGSS